MENLNREAILRMLSGKTGNSSSGGGGGDIDLAGYATMIWVTENFVSIDFFRELFRAYDSNSQEILPNDTTSVVNNIKAMVGTWTEEYLTALGNAGGGGGGGGGAQYLNDLLDVQLTTPLTDGQALVYNATLQKWVNGAAGVNMTTVWNALAGSTNEQINASHLSTALSGYVTTSAISDMATQTWVGQQGFATQTWVTSNFITIAYFDRLFRAYNNSTLVSHNDTTSTIDNIKAMFGFWTDFYLSALGTGGVSSVSISLSQLADVNVAGVTNGQVLSYNSTNAEWVNTSLKTINGNSIIGTGDLTIAGVSTLSGLTDVLLTSLAGSQVLIWNAQSSKWVNSSLKTVNGYSILGSGDIPASGGGSGNYLPIAGGTMTGGISFGYSVRSYDTVNNQITNYDNNLHLNVRNNILVISKMGANGFRFNVSRATGSNQECYLNGNSGISPQSANNGIIGGDGYEWAEIDGRAVFARHLNGSRTFYHQGYNADLYLNYYDTDKPAGNTYINANNNGLVGIGTTNPTDKLHVNGTIRGGAIIMNNNLRDEQANGTWYLGYNAGYPTSAYNLSHSSAGLIISVSTGGLTSQGYITALSDIRHKTVIKDAAVSVEDIARMPAVMYQWNDGRDDKELHVGSIAQNWQTVLPEVVLKANDDEGTLSMQYGVAALVSSIIIARKVVNHEDRIKQLEKENKELKKRLNIA